MLCYKDYLDFHQWAVLCLSSWEDSRSLTLVYISASMLYFLHCAVSAQRLRPGSLVWIFFSSSGSHFLSLLDLYSRGSSSIRTIFIYKVTSKWFTSSRWFVLYSMTRANLVMAFCQAWMVHRGHSDLDGTQSIRLSRGSQLDTTLCSSTKKQLIRFATILLAL